MKLKALFLLIAIIFIINESTFVEAKSKHDLLTQTIEKKNSAKRSKGSSEPEVSSIKRPTTVSEVSPLSSDTCL
jgi:hypothetical protein